MDTADFQARAERYAEFNCLTLHKTRMAFGQDGQLWATEQTTAIKVFERQSNYDRELSCYQRLQQRGITAVHGFSIPKFVRSSDELLVVEMGIVRPPFVVDFGKAYLDVRPLYTPEAMEDWEHGLSELFGNRVPEVKALLRAFEVIGIYYLDAKPGNITFANEPP